ncbi:hypothetical protein [Mariprofundus erugo]|uniref:hypothetical protein n=1 Tax=Mariprofundus erugo TaxID=2528639 RepID=UPI001EE97564|nr:hypothetical protein [Mariprofundus erugo]
MCATTLKRCYSIDALSAAGDKAWRLQDDGQWRPCTYAEPLQPHDARITDNKEAEYWPGRRLKKDNQGALIPQQKAGVFDFLMRGIFAHVVTHHLEEVTLPERKQMECCIADSPAGTPWLLYLDADGGFHTMNTATHSIIGNLNIAVRGEISSSPDFTGPLAVTDEGLMDRTYRQFLGGWLEHLNTSRMNVFVPDVEKLKEEADYIEAIRNWRHE